MVVLRSEMNGPMTIDTVSWQRAGSLGDSPAWFGSFRIYMGTTELDELTTSFDDNYTPGTRKLVYQPGTQTMQAEPDQWVDMVLDTPFEYDGEENLVIEVIWNVSAEKFYTYAWNTGSCRALLNTDDLQDPTGYRQQFMSRLRFSEEQTLDQVTFAAIKTMW